MRLIIILQMVLVASAGERLMQNRMGEMLANDLKAVLTALQRSYPQKLKLPSGTLDTEETVIDFLFVKEDVAMIKKVMSEVDTLDLTGMHLERLPVHVIQQLPNLNTLILDGNKGLSISQDDIKMIDHIPIDKVSIRESNISPETFMALQELPKLTNLDISGNELLSTHTGSDKFGDLTTRLVELRAAECKLHGNWLDAILKCTNLKFLDVSGNTELFKGRVPTTNFGFMKGLTGLHVSWCDLGGGWLDNILECTSLIDLNISHNDSIGANHTSFKNLKGLRSLKTLNVEACRLTTKSLNKICKSKSLKELGVGYNVQLWNGSVNFGRCRSRLVKLSIAGTEASEDVLRAICGLSRRECSSPNLIGLYGEGGFPKLAILDVSGNDTLGSVISQEGFSFECLEKTLTELNVMGIGVKGGSAIKAICGCVRLVKLNAAFNPDLWSGADGMDFGRLKSQLQVLDAGSTNLPPAILSKILQFDKLVELKIHFNDTSCGDLASNEANIGGVKNTLRKIDMAGTGLTGEGLQWIFRELNGLEYVCVAGNPGITSSDLMGLNFTTLWDRLVQLNVTTYSRAQADQLQKKLPLTRIC